jgi:hypothetical protein
MICSHGKKLIPRTELAQRQYQGYDSPNKGTACATNPGMYHQAGE